MLASEILVYALVVEGKWAASIPYFGFERRGAPVAAFVRFDDKPIREKTQIYNPDCVVVLDEKIKGSVDVFSGMKDGGIAVLNRPASQGAHGLPAVVKRAAFVDATKISVETLGAIITNTCMLGAFAAATGCVGLESIKLGIREMIPSKSFAGNALAAERGFFEAEIVDF